MDSRLCHVFGSSIFVRSKCGARCLKQVAGPSVLVTGFIKAQMFWGLKTPSPRPLPASRAAE